MKPYDWAEEITGEIKGLPTIEELPVPVETVIEATLGHVPEITGRA